MLNRYFIILLLVTASALTALFCFRLFIADINYENANTKLNSWDREKKIEKTTDYELALNSINSAIKFNPNNPHYLDTKARIISRGIVLNNDEQEKYQEVISLYHESLEKRKNWPVTWVELASVNAYVHGITPETISYINNALEYGPYNRFVITTASGIFLNNWESLNTEEKLFFFRLLDIAASKPQILTTVIQDAQSVEMEKLICIQIKYKSQFNKYQQQWPFKGICGF